MKDLDEFFNDHLDLPIGGKVYHVPPVDGVTGLKLQRMFAKSMGQKADGGDGDADTELDDVAEKGLYRTGLGPVYDELEADGVSWPRIKHAGVTAFIWHSSGIDQAELFWEHGGPGKALPPQRRTNRRK